MKLKERHLGYLFVLPALMMLLIVVLIPIVDAFVMSFQAGGGWGLDNYLRIFSDPASLNSWGKTFIFVTVSTFAHILLGLGSAILLNRQVKGKGVYRTLVLIPWVISVVVAGTTWRWLFHSQYGVFNDVLTRLGLAPIFWLDNPTTAMIGVIIANIWNGFPFIMVILLAGLQTIPKEQYEAAAIDGASSFQQFRFVTLPNLNVVMSIALIMDLINNFKAFGLVNVMTEGGPVNATLLVSINIYRNFMKYFDYGFATANGVLLLFMMLGLSMVYLKMMVRE